VKITGLHIYPIKSLGGISVSESKALTEGFEYDRRWMLVDKEGQFLTQREHAKMALFSCAIRDNKLEITTDNETQSISLQENTETAMPVKVSDIKTTQKTFH